MTELSSDGPPVGILARSAAVTEVLAASGPLSLGDISERTGTPRASVYRLVDALAAIGMVRTRPNGLVELSLRWLRLADTASNSLTEWAHAQPVLDELAARSGQTAFLSVPRADAAMCIRWSQGSGIGVLILRPGRSLPLHAGAAGRLCLAFRDDLDELLDRAPFPAFTARTLTGRAQLLADASATRRRGYSVSDQDVTEGIAALGAAVVDGRGMLRAAVSIGGLASDFDQQERLAADLLLAADRLRVDLP